MLPDRNKSPRTDVRLESSLLNSPMLIDLKWTSVGNDKRAKEIVRLCVFQEDRTFSTLTFAATSRFARKLNVAE